MQEKLGEGGLGAVYRAEDITDGTIVAVKMLHGRWNNQPAALQRLHKEARLLAEVNNPYVANLIEMNEDQGIHYLVLEFVSGQSLRALQEERKRLDEPLAVAIMADVARALVEAHKRGIVHRDIKPENILVNFLPSESDLLAANGAATRASDVAQLPRQVVRLWRGPACSSIRIPERYPGGFGRGDAVVRFSRTVGRRPGGPTHRRVCPGGYPLSPAGRPAAIPGG